MGFRVLVLITTCWCEAAWEGRKQMLVFRILLRMQHEPVFGHSWLGTIKYPVEQTSRKSLRSSENEAWFYVLVKK